MKIDILFQFSFSFLPDNFFLNLEVCNEIDQWPAPIPGLTLNLPLMGVVLQVCLRGGGFSRGCLRTVVPNFFGLVTPF